MNQTKQCSKCNKRKKLSSFPKASWCKLGVRPECKNCRAEDRSRRYYAKLAHNKEVNKKWRTANKEHLRKYHKAYRTQLREEILQAYGAKCVCCGEKEPMFLSIDHVLNDGNIHRKEKGKGHLYEELKALGFPKDRFQLLCYNCNKGKFLNGGKCPHES